jgi:hypothetical protein
MFGIGGARGSEGAFLFDALCGVAGCKVGRVIIPWYICCIMIVVNKGV